MHVFVICIDDFDKKQMRELKVLRGEDFLQKGFATTSKQRITLLFIDHNKMYAPRHPQVRAIHVSAAPKFVRVCLSELLARMMLDQRCCAVALQISGVVHRQTTYTLSNHTATLPSIYSIITPPISFHTIVLFLSSHLHLTNTPTRMSSTRLTIALLISAATAISANNYNNNPQTQPPYGFEPTGECQCEVPTTPPPPTHCPLACTNPVEKCDNGCAYDYNYWFSIGCDRWPVPTITLGNQHYLAGYVQENILPTCVQYPSKINGSTLLLACQVTANTLNEAAGTGLSFASVQPYINDAQGAITSYGISAYPPTCSICQQADIDNDIYNIGLFTQLNACQDCGCGSSTPAPTFTPTQTPSNNTTPTNSTSTNSSSTSTENSSKTSASPSISGAGALATAMVSMLVAASLA